jgi:hypothetical protein
MKTLLTLFCIFFGFFSEAQVLPIYENGKTGLIDVNGNVLIKPKFHSIGIFSDGLAPARLKGTYGFINEKGKYIIPAIYDYAEPFYNGFARVWKDGNLFIINYNGEIQTQLSNKYDIENFDENGLAIIKEKNEINLNNYDWGDERQVGLIHKSGNVLLNPEYNTITHFSDGYAVITKEINSKIEYGLINTSGEFVIPFGIYKEINFFSEGYAIVSYCLNNTNGKNCQTFYAFIDKNLKEIGGIAENDSCSLNYYDKYVRNNLVKVNLTRKFESKKITYQSYCNLKGEILFKEPKYEQIGEFNFGKAFAKIKQEKLKGYFVNCYVVINMKGEIVSNFYFDDMFEYPLENKFDNFGRAIVKYKGNYAIIDTAFNFILPPKFANIFYTNNPNYFVVENSTKRLELDRDTVRITHYYSNKKFETIHTINKVDTITENIKDLNLDKSSSIKVDKFYGILNINDYKNVNYEYDNVRLIDENDILINNKGGKFSYFNLIKNNYIYQDIQKQEKNVFIKNNIDYTLNSYYTASSTPSKNLDEFGYEWGYNGWAMSNNFPIIIDSLNKISYKKNQLKLIVDDTKKNKEDNFLYYHAFLINDNKDTLYLNAEDSRVNIIIQAKDKKGEWKDIQTYYHSDCGNSYHTIKLEPHYFWKFKIPIFDGVFKTTLRLVLLIDEDTNKKILSNEFKGRINPSQFWRKEYFFRGNNIMDVY